MQLAFMKHRLAIFSGAAAVVSLGLPGCYSQQRSNAAAAQQGGGSHSAITSWSGTHKAAVKDPGNGETAFTVDVPSGWKFAGTILRSRDCHSPATAVDGLSITVLSPDGVTAAGQVPGVTWSWTSDGGSAQGPKCQPVDITTASGFLLNIAAPMMHPTAKIVGVMPLPENMRAGLEAQRRNMNAAGGPNSRQTLDSARIRIEYDFNGQRVEEQLGTVMTCWETYTPAYPQMRRPARTVRNCSTHGTYFKRAPKGQLDAFLANNLPPAQIDREWDAHISERMRANFAAYQKANDEQFQAIQRQYQEQTQAMLKRGAEFQNNLKLGTERALAQARATQAATDHAAHQQMLDSLNRAEFVDPTTGQHIQTSSQFNHNWISSDKSTVVLGDDPTLDPNGVIDPVRQSFIQLIPAN